jgi:hypothetical protein
MQFGDFAALLYTWMIPHAVDLGCIETDDPEEILMMIMPGRRDKTPHDIDVAISNMEDMELVSRDGGKVYFPYASFYKYQTYVKESNRRKDHLLPISGNQRKTAENTDDQRKTPTNPTTSRVFAENAASPSLSPSLSPSPSESTPPNPRKRGKDLDSDLNAIEIPGALKTPEFTKALGRWKLHRQEIKHPLKRTMLESQIATFAEWGAARSIAAINHTILMGWQGLREPESSTRNNGHKHTSEQAGPSEVTAKGVVTIKPENYDTWEDYAADCAEWGIEPQARPDPSPSSDDGSPF